LASVKPSAQPSDGPKLRTLTLLNPWSGSTTTLDAGSTTAT
jgi:hypothetical protein